MAENAEPAWVDIQRGLGWTIVLAFAFLLISMAAHVVIYGAVTDTLELFKQGLNTLTNIVLVVTGFFFGSSKSSQSKDETQAMVVEKLTSPPPNGPVAPVTVPARGYPWWALLTDPEKTALMDAAQSDARVQTFIATSTAGTAKPDDLKYLVTAGLLTAERAAVIQST